MWIRQDQKKDTISPCIMKAMLLIKKAQMDNRS